MMVLLIRAYLGVSLCPAELAACSNPGDRNWIHFFRKVRIPERLVDVEARCAMMCRIGAVALLPHAESV